jgi:hypothetical protein
MTAPPPVYEVPSFDEGKQIWTAGYFVLRGSGDNRDAVCINPAGGIGFAQWQTSNANMVVNRCIGFRGALIGQRLAENGRDSVGWGQSTRKASLGAAATPQHCRRRRRSHGCVLADIESP